MIIMPAKVEQLVGKALSTGHLSAVVLAGTIVAVLAAPIFGAISDRWQMKSGRRRTQMAVGVIGNIVFFLVMGFATNFATFLIGFVGVQLFNNVAGSSYQGLIPDLVAHEQRGTASGFMGTWNNLGVIVGAGFAFALAGMGYWYATAILLLLGLVVTLLLVREPRPPVAQPFDLGAFLRGFLIGGAEYRDFWWVYLTRFIVMLGLYVLEFYLSYYLQFVMGVKNPAGTIVLILIILTVAALLTGLSGGYLSDRVGKRKFLVTWAGILMGLASLLFVFMHVMIGIYVAAAVFGLGYGAYMATDYALVVDTLPTKNAAKDLGIWGTSTTLPQTFASMIGLALAALVIPHWGYSVGYRSLFAVTFVLFLIGSVLVRKVRKVA
jgi:MFS family permease